MDDSTSPNTGLRHHLRIVRRRKWTIILCVVLLVGLSAVYDYLKTPEYVATAQVQLMPQISTSLLQANDSSLLNAATPVDVPTDSKVIQSANVAKTVRSQIPHAPSVVVTQLGVTDVVSLSVTSTSPHVAAAAANAYGASYIKLQRYEAAKALSNATSIIQKNINQNQTTINGLQSQLSTLSPNSPALQSLVTQLTSLDSTQVTLRQQIYQYTTAASLITGGGQVITPATVPTSPSAPKPLEYGILAALVGLLIGVGLAYLLERFDEKVRSTEDVLPIIGRVPLIGVVPSVGEWRDGAKPYLVTMRSPSSPVSEAYRSLRTSVRFLALDRDIRKLLFTSPIAAEGKTSTVANIAVAMAQAGQRVVAVDCDLRRPRLHSFFQLPNDAGFTSVLLDKAVLDDVLYEIPGQTNLRVMPSGLVPPNPSELLSARRAAEVLDSLGTHADIVLIDSPPIVPVTDATVLSSEVDALVLVTATGVTTRPDLIRALDTLQRVDAPLAGVVLNRATANDSYAYYNYSSSGAHPPGGGEAGGNGRRRPAHAGGTNNGAGASLVGRSAPVQDG